MDSGEVLERRLARAKAEIAQLEGMIEDRTRSLFLAEKELRGTMAFLEQIMASMSSAVFVVDPDGSLKSANPAALQLWGRGEAEVLGLPCSELLQLADGTHPAQASDLLMDHAEVRLRHADGHQTPALFNGSALADGEGETPAIVCVATDLTEQRRLEVELRHAQKLESVGQLAAGIAHEINTPIQFVGDSVDFLEDAFGDLLEIQDVYDALRAKIGDDPQVAPLLSRLAEAEDEADLEFLREELPAALKRVQDGIQRVGKIVGAMNEFAHPGSVEKSLEDLNHAIETTLTVSRSAHKYAAEVTTELGKIPLVPCIVGDFNQVVLNLVVNAAHAIQDQRGDSGGLGHITVRTRDEGRWVRVEVQDDGGGIPPEVQPRIFDPFFTTKEVGRGTGQGLSIAHHIIVEKHGGELSFDTEPGVGTTFVLRLPLG